MMKQAEGDEEDAEDDSDDSENASDSDGDDLPLCCQACRERWENCTSIPIQTICGHYFCEDCAMTNYARTPKCMVCDQPTNGIFNSADKLEEKLKQKQADKEAKKNQLKMPKRNYQLGGVSLED